jgi:hypothetical protein
MLQIAHSVPRAKASETDMPMIGAGSGSRSITAGPRRGAGQCTLRLRLRRCAELDRLIGGGNGILDSRTSDQDVLMALMSIARDTIVVRPYGTRAS